MYAKKSNQKKRSAGREPVLRTGTPRATDPVFADAVRLFADALPEPCIVLDRRSVVVHINPAAKSGVIEARYRRITH